VSEGAEKPAGHVSKNKTKQKFSPSPLADANFREPSFSFFFFLHAHTPTAEENGTAPIEKTAGQSRAVRSQTPNTFVFWTPRQYDDIDSFEKKIQHSLLLEGTTYQRSHSEQTFVPAKSTPHTTLYAEFLLFFFLLFFSHSISADTIYSHTANSKP
jgi:hypothetical protein